MPISPADGGIKNYHNYFVPEEFTRRDPETQNLYLRDGQRAVYASEDFIVGLHSGLTQEVGDAANLIMYKCGYEWGVNDMKRFSERMRHEFGGGKLDVWQMNRQFVMESWWWPLTVEGWGGWTIDFGFEKQSMVFITIRNSAVAKSMEQVGKPVCHMYAGMFAGVFSVYEREERDAIEVQCYAMGNDSCKFLISKKDKVNAAEFWRREGANAQEILERLA
ncbi:MAG TPA: 4-vinyl reductase [Acidobacteriota bacterium]|jgi:predicted hydrocarbon binding protein|nr:4-vinyl reductase [Acidobacteriota bacterium]HMZ78728.1 4-vinyl reductase [Acidobacteriota bacterium]HNB70953.1 4-vinyl reductase [Acidobacteriota bacterium]HND18303.1 4-vinyl reductase [Acidobacteriota bacterium]HNG95454.1 4-vinyl reductase [Acidobacteriota bacterium]